METVGQPTPAAERLRYQLTRLQTAPQLYAVYACLFDLPRRERQPRFAELTLVNRQLLFARAEGEQAFRHFVGRRDVLVNDLVRLVGHLRLGTTALTYVLGRVDRLASGAPKKSHDVFRPYS